MVTVLEKPQTHVESPEVLESFNPATGEKLGEVKLFTPADVAAAAARAREAQKGWAAMGIDGRARILHRLRHVMLDRIGEIADVIHRENGKARHEAVTMVLPICEAIKFYAKVGRKVERGVKVNPTALFFGNKARIFYDPLGVAGFIMPWNFPFELGLMHMIPALMAGNACVQKPSEANPLIGELIGKLLKDAGVPSGVVEIVHGYADVGAALIDNVDVICFVGSPATGRKIMERAAKRLIPVHLELGGKDAAIVRADADLAKTAQGLVFGTCYNAGQVCCSVERIYAHKDIAPALISEIVKRVGELRQATDGINEVGPIAWPPQQHIYEAHIKDAVEKGAKIHTGGKVIEKNGGKFWPPTVLTGVNHEMKLMTEETFGPFIPIMPVENDDEAIRLANDSPYGLGGSVWTTDTAEGERVARRMKTGSVVINNAVVQPGCVTVPFGGEKESGVGRTMSEHGYFNYVAPKTVLRTMRARGPEIGWMPYNDKNEDMMIGLAELLNAPGIMRRLRGLPKVIAGLRAGGKKK